MKGLSNLNSLFFAKLFLDKRFSKAKW